MGQLRDICPAGSKKVSDAAECRTATQRLGLRTPKEGPYGQHPHFCIIRWEPSGGQHGLVIFNTGTDSPHNDYLNVYKPICVVVPPTPSPTAAPTPDPTPLPTAEPTASPTAEPTTPNPTVEPTEAPTETPTKAEDFHASKVTEHSSYQTQFTSDCEPCLIAEKYAADNATECTQKHKDAEQDAVSLGEAQSALDACEKLKLAAEAEVATAKSNVASMVTELSTATAADDAQTAKKRAEKLCTGLIDAWITKTDNVAPCDEASGKVEQSKTAYEKSRAAAIACDSRAQMAKDEAAIACANLVNAVDS